MTYIVNNVWTHAYTQSQWDSNHSHHKSNYTCATYDCYAWTCLTLTKISHTLAICHLCYWHCTMHCVHQSLYEHTYSHDKNMSQQQTHKNLTCQENKPCSSIPSEKRCGKIRGVPPHEKRGRCATGHRNHFHNYFWEKYNSISSFCQSFELSSLP